MKHFSDYEIIEGILSKHPPTINKIVTLLYKQHSKMISQMVYTNGGGLADAEDLFQELMVVFLENVETGKYQLQPDAKIKTYLYRIAQNIWYKKIRDSNTRKRHENNAASEKDNFGEFSVQNDYLIAQELENALRIFKNLRNDYQQILEAFYNHEQSMEEIARALKLPSSNAAKTMKYRALQDLKTLLSNYIKPIRLNHETSNRKD